MSASSSPRSPQEAAAKGPAKGAAADAAAKADQYRQSLFALLGGRDPLEVQAELLPSLQAVVAGLDDALLHKPEKSGKWSMAQVIQHLADTEIVIGFRLRAIVAEPRPPIPAFDQDAWCSELHYERARVEEALEQLRVLRAANLRLLRSLNESQFERVGMHVERGPETIRTITKLIAAHDTVHRNQMQRIRKALGR